MNALTQRASIAFQALPPVRRYLLLGGWVVVLTLVLVLLGRPVVAAIKEMSQWPQLARLAQTLSAGPVFTAEQWQTLASARGIVLTKAEQRGEIWLLRGEVTGAEALARLMRSIQEQGGTPMRWSLEQGHQAMLFSLDVGRGSAVP